MCIQLVLFVRKYHYTRSTKHKVYDCFLVLGVEDGILILTFLNALWSEVMKTSTVPGLTILCRILTTTDSLYHRAITYIEILIVKIFIQQEMNGNLCVCVFVCVYRPPLWSSGQSFWLQIQRSRVRFPALPGFTEQQWV